MSGYSMQDFFLINFFSQINKVSGIYIFIKNHDFIFMVKLKTIFIQDCSKRCIIQTAILKDIFVLFIKLVIFGVMNS